ncbi:MAG: hypothetical protein KME17_21455 [Cyanosarcina radialis HA8281-LM2]|nr:hypothetical protein [Cyanosarcina radialis HA8281-LM2]
MQHTKKSAIAVGWVDGRKPNKPDPSSLCGMATLKRSRHQWCCCVSSGKSMFVTGSIEPSALYLPPMAVKPIRNLQFAIRN